MRFDLYLRHVEQRAVGRRGAMRLAVRAGAAAGLTAVQALSVREHAAGAGMRSARIAHRPYAAQLADEPLNDDMFDVAAVEAGAWSPGPYGPGDERGSFNEVTPVKTAEALRLLDAGRPVLTYNLGEWLFRGFPAFPSDPPRVYEQTLAISGIDPAPPGTISLRPEALGANRLTSFEERVGTTYQIGTQLDNLNHIGVGEMYYNGITRSDMISPEGTKMLGNEHMGPIVTRGIVLDILGMKIAQGATGDFFTATNGARVLRDNYRITVEDIEEAMARQDIGGIQPGDAVLFRTGWTQLVRTDPDRYIAQEPGIYLREARYLSRFRPALIGSDTWALEALDPNVTKGAAFATHQLLIIRNGIRIGEGIVTEALVEDSLFEFVYFYAPQNATGATAGNTPPVALGQPPR